MSSLYWLPEHDDWDRRLKALTPDTSRAEAWAELVRLACAPLDVVRSNRLDRARQTLFGELAPETLDTPPARLAVLASSNVSHLLPSLRTGALRRGLWLETYTADYGQYYQDLANPASSLARFAPTEVLLSLDANHVVGALDPMASADAVADILAGKLAHIAECWRICRERLEVPCVQQAILPIFSPLLGNNEHRLPGSRARFIVKLNEAMRAAAGSPNILSVDEIAARDGVATWYQPAMWLKAKQEIAPAVAPVYGDLVARLIAARRGRSYKCLVLDLDNTLWGGVIGDDGLEGIVVGQGSASGESFLALQHYAKDLSRRGVLLAVCSKNDEATARLPFADHPDMILRLDDISAFVANWDDKAQNIRRIAARLNIGLDALVFVDDNPFERELVRAELPMVAVPEVPDDPVLVARCIADAGYFESLAITADDAKRVAQYRANEERTHLAAQSADLESYLRRLDMRLIRKAFAPEDLARVTQLINKTNQFNLTTRRYTSEEVEAVMRADDAIGLQFRLLDSFGDNGIIAVVIGREVAGAIAIDTWLMSCRVLGRQVESAILTCIVEAARRRGAIRIEGVFKPSAKNAMVREHYGSLGFARDRVEPDGTSAWHLDLSTWTQPDLVMTIV